MGRWPRGDVEFSAAVDQTTGPGRAVQSASRCGRQLATAPTRRCRPARLHVLGSSSSQSTNISIVNGQMLRQVRSRSLRAPGEAAREAHDPPARDVSGQGYQTAIDITCQAPQAGGARAAASRRHGRRAVPIEATWCCRRADRRTVYVVSLTLESRWERGSESPGQLGPRSLRSTASGRKSMGCRQFESSDGRSRQAYDVAVPQARRCIASPRDDDQADASTSPCCSRSRFLGIFGSGNEDEK